MSELNKPEISPDFTIDDIHKVGEWNYERRKNMTPEEVSADIKRGADAFLELLKPMVVIMLYSICVGWNATEIRLCPAQSKPSPRVFMRAPLLRDENQKHLLLEFYKTL